MMNLTNKIATVSAACALMVTPVMAQSYHRHHNDNGTWAAATVLSAGVGLYGASRHDNGLAALGAIGALYSLSQLDSHHGRDYCEPNVRYVSPRRYERVIVEPRHSRGWDRFDNHRDRFDNRRDDRHDNRRGDRHGRGW